MAAMRVKVRLHRGPYDGFVDKAMLPLEQIVTVAYCANCRCRHLHKVIGHTSRLASAPLYLRAPERDQDGELAYEFVDVDDTLERITGYEQARQVVETYEARPAT